MSQHRAILQMMDKACEDLSSEMTIHFNEVEAKLHLVGAHYLAMKTLLERTKNASVHYNNRHLPKLAALWLENQINASVPNKVGETIALLAQRNRGKNEIMDLYDRWLGNSFAKGSKLSVIELIDSVLEILVKEEPTKR